MVLRSGGGGGDRNERKTKRKLSQRREIPAVRLARRFRVARWRQRRRPRLLLDEKRRRGRRSGGGGATRKKVYRLQRSEKLRFRSQHRRHSSASFAAPYPRILSTCILPRPQPQEFGPARTDYKGHPSLLIFPYSLDYVLLSVNERFMRAVRKELCAAHFFKANCIR